MKSPRSYEGRNRLGKGEEGAKEKLYEKSPVGHWNTLAYGGDQKKRILKCLCGGKEGNA